MPGKSKPRSCAPRRRETVDGVRSTSLLERVLYLRMFDATGGARSTDLAVIAELCRERYFPKGAVMRHMGEMVDTIHLIIEGRVEIRTEDLQLADLGPGDAVGWLQYMAKDPQGLEAIAATDVHCLDIDAEALMEVLEDRFNLTYGMIKGSSKRLLALLIENPWVFTDLSSFDMPAPRKEMDFVERIAFLRKAPIFKRSSINALAELSRGMNEVRFDAGTEIWKKGDASGGIFVIIDGAVRCRSDEDAIDFTLGPGGPLGSIESISEMPRFYDAAARTEVTALHTVAETLLDVFEDNFEMASDYLQVIATDVIRISKMRAGVERASGAVSIAGMSKAG